VLQLQPGDGLIFKRTGQLPNGIPCTSLTVLPATQNPHAAAILGVRRSEGVASSRVWWIAFGIVATGTCSTVQAGWIVGCANSLCSTRLLGANDAEVGSH
jgi:hypothetical protein